MQRNNIYSLHVQLQPRGGYAVGNPLGENTFVLTVIVAGVGKGLKITSKLTV